MIVRGEQRVVERRERGRSLISHTSFWCDLYSRLFPPFVVDEVVRARRSEQRVRLIPILGEEDLEVGGRVYTWQNGSHRSQRYVWCRGSVEQWQVESHQISLRAIGIF